MSMHDLSSAPHAVEARHVEFSYGGRTVLRNFTFRMVQGTITVVLGPSGCGKTTIINLIAGFCFPDQGEVRVFGQKVLGPGADRALVSQEDALFPWMTVFENVGIGNVLQRLSVAERDLMIREWTERVGLTDWGASYPKALSGGMRQRVALARAWANEPSVLLLDEPLRSLDWARRLQLQELIRALATGGHQSVLLVTHDPDEALHIGDEVVVLDSSAEPILQLQLPFRGLTVAERRARPDLPNYRSALERYLSE